MRFLPKVNATNEDRVKQIETDLIRREAQIGGQLFGAIPKGHTRQFFCLDQHTWVWYESWSDRSGHHSITTRYEIRPNGIFKVQNNGTFQSLTKGEARNLLKAVNLYSEKIVGDYQASLQTV